MCMYVHTYSINSIEREESGGKRETNVGEPYDKITRGEEHDGILLPKESKSVYICAYILS